MTLTVTVCTYDPLHDHAVELDAVAFQVVDRSEGDGVRGVHVGEWPGVVRPKLEWKVEGVPGPGRALAAAAMHPKSIGLARRRMRWETNANG